MYFSVIAVTFSALSFLVGAVPASLKSSRTGGLFSIPLTKRSNHLDHRGFVDVEKMHACLQHSAAKFDQALIAYERNTGKPHSLALKRGNSKERRIFVPVNLTSIVNVVWTADIAVGTPAKPFSVLIDTTTADMFLAGLLCPSCSAKHLYEAFFSSTAKIFYRNVTADFGFGQTKGDLVSDTVSVGGNQVNNQAIVVAKSTSPFFQFPANTGDGMLGFGFPETSAFRSKSYFGNLIESGGPSNGAQVFGLYLAKSGPELIIGGRDSSKISGNMTVLDVDKSGFWQIQIDDIVVDGAATVGVSEAIIDTGNPFISSNLQNIANIYGVISGSTPFRNTGLWTIPCDTKAKIIIDIGGTAFEIPSSAYILGAVSNVPGCLGAFAVLDQLSSTIRLGTSFLQNVYTEFDQKNMKVGFAKTA